jgi:hypothetical protein
VGQFGVILSPSTLLSVNFTKDLHFSNSLSKNLQAEESAFVFNDGAQQQILRSAQNDRFAAYFTQLH